MNPTRRDIDALLRFLPLFDVPDRPFTLRWAGGEPVDENTITAPYPVYAEDVVEFFGLAGQPCWSDYSYDPGEAYRMLADDDLVATATLDEIKTMLTYCVRSERFGDGSWASLLESGRVLALLRRLAALRAGQCHL